MPVLLKLFDSFWPHCLIVQLLLFSFGVHAMFDAGCSRSLRGDISSQVSRTFQGVVYKRPLSLISSGGLHPQKVSVVGCLKSLIEDSGGNFKKAVCKFQSFSYNHHHHHYHHHHHHHPLYYSKRFGQGLVEDYSILMVKTDITIHIHPS